MYSRDLVLSDSPLWVDSRAFNNVDEAITFIGSDNRTLYINRSENISKAIPSNISLSFGPEGRLVSNVGQVIVSSPLINASEHQLIFDIASLGSWSVQGVSILHSSWFGSLENALVQSSGLKKEIQVGIDDTLASDLSTYDLSGLTVVIKPGVTVTHTVSQTTNFCYDPQKGGLISAAIGVTLTINSFNGAGKLYQIFTGDGDIKFGAGAVEAVYPEWLGAKRDGITDDFDSFSNAVNTGMDVHLSKGTYVVSGNVWYSEDYQSISGSGIGKTILTVTEGRRGQTIRATDKIGISLSKMTIDTDNGDTEGSLFWAGVSDGIIEKVEFLNGDLTTINISGNSPVQPSTQECNNNIVRDCIAKGQKRYTPGGTAPFIAGNNAKNTTFINCYAEDCAADAFGSDHAHNTVFRNCKAVSTAGSTYYGFWSEGGEEPTTVTWENCYVEGYSGIGTSELVKGTIRGCRFKNINLNSSSKAIWARVNTTISDCLFDNCYPADGVDNYATTLFEAGGSMEGCRFDNCNGKAAIISYKGAEAASDNIVNISRCLFNDAMVTIGYGNSGAKCINISNCQFNDSYIWSYDTVDKYAKTDHCVFNRETIDQCISTNRIGKHLITDCHFNSTGTSPTGTAVYCGIDHYNTVIMDSYFDNFEHNAVNATLKKGNVFLSDTTDISDEPENVLNQAQVTIVEGGTYYDIPYAGPAYAGVLIVNGDSADNATSVVSFSDSSLGATNGNYNILSESPDYDTSNKWQFTYNAGEHLKITHPTAGRIARIIILLVKAGKNTEEIV